MEPVGYVLPDVELEKLGPTRCLIASNRDGGLERGMYVKVGGGGRFYVSQVVDGPYYLEEGEGYRTVYTLDLALTVSGAFQSAVLDRPAPKTPVYPLEEEAVQGFLGAVGDIAVGRLATQGSVRVGLDSATLTRHVGIFGTTGSGKSNTIQVMMEEASKAGFAVLVFDVEGEYVMMDQPTDRLQDLLEDFGLKPRGVDNLAVYTPHPCASRRGDAVRFGIPFKDVDKQVFSEVAGLNRMEQLYFMDLIEKVEAIAPAFRKITLQAVLERLKGRLEAQADNPTMPPYIAEAHTSLYSKLTAIQGLGVVDAPAKPVKIPDLLAAGKVSIVDFSDASDPVKNIVIADLLHKVFKYKIAHPDTPRLFIVLEEAHTFISREKRGEMMATLILLLELARRGRKRGICLNIVTQQPAHLPPELLELCNTRIMHRMSSTTNIQSLKESTGNVPEAFWDTLPSLSRGQALIASPRYTQAIIAQVRPVMSKRLATE